jgi:hypothetical protein
MGLRWQLICVQGIEIQLASDGESTWGNGGVAATT